MKYNEQLFWSFTQFTVSAIVVKGFLPKDNTIIFCEDVFNPFFSYLQNNK